MKTKEGCIIQLPPCAHREETELRITLAQLYAGAGSQQHNREPKKSHRKWTTCPAQLHDRIDAFAHCLTSVLQDYPSTMRAIARGEKPLYVMAVSVDFLQQRHLPPEEEIREWIRSNGYPLRIPRKLSCLYNYYCSPYIRDELYGKLQAEAVVVWHLVTSRSLHYLESAELLEVTDKIIVEEDDGRGF